MRVLLVSLFLLIASASTAPTDYELDLISGVVGCYHIDPSLYRPDQETDWHFVQITWDLDTLTFKWRNRGGVSWSLMPIHTGEDWDTTQLEAGPDCPYLEAGHKFAAAEWEGSPGHSNVSAIVGPWGEVYFRQQSCENMANEAEYKNQDLKTAGARKKRGLGRTLAEGMGSIWTSFTRPVKTTVELIGKGIRAAKQLKNYVTGRSYESGVIVLNGFVTPGVVNEGFYSALRLGLASTVRVMAPSAPKRLDSWNCLPSSIMAAVVDGNNWFNMCTNDGLDEAVRTVEGYIEEMVEEGIPSEKIVLIGLSQGGATALYTALNTKYKLGGIVGIVTWLPRCVSGVGPHVGLIKLTIDDTVEDPADKTSVVNKDTPLLHINGRQDPIVHLSTGEATYHALSKAIPDYTWDTYPGTHTTCCAHPIALTRIGRWLEEKTSVMITSLLPFVK